MARFVRSRLSVRSQGFTLLELIIVLVVLAALAALVIPTLGFVRDQAKYATAAAGAAEVLNNLELYKSATGSYPARLDSLVNTGGSAYSKGYVASTGGFPLGPIVDGGSDSKYTYYYMSNGGLPSLVNHDEAATDPNASTASTPVVATSAGEGLKYATVDPTALASSTYAAKARDIVRTCYPNQVDQTNVRIPDGHTLVALGVGSRASNVGSTLTSAPTWPGASQGKYSRYIALFDVSAGPTGRGRVALKAVVDTEFGSIASNVKGFRDSIPNDDQGVYVAPTSTGGP